MRKRLWNSEADCPRRNSGVLTPKADNQFLMEAMWTRFLPVMVKVREWLADGAIGEPRLLIADHGTRKVLSTETLEGRHFNPELGGGGLLDVGVYLIALAYTVFGVPSKITSLAHLGQMNVDEQASILLGYDTGQIANLFCAIRTETSKEARITDTKGSIHIPQFLVLFLLRLKRELCVKKRTCVHV